MIWIALVFFSCRCWQIISSSFRATAPFQRPLVSSRRETCEQRITENRWEHIVAFSFVFFSFFRNQLQTFSLRCPNPTPGSAPNNDSNKKKWLWKTKQRRKPALDRANNRLAAECIVRVFLLSFHIVFVFLPNAVPTFRRPRLSSVFFSFFLSFFLFFLISVASFWFGPLFIRHHRSTYRDH